MISQLFVVVLFYTERFLHGIWRSGFVGIILNTKNYYTNTIISHKNYSYYYTLQYTSTLNLLDID